MNLFITLISLLIILGMGYLIIKQYQTQTVLFFAGILLLTVAVLLGKRDFLPSTVSSTGFVGFDIFLAITGLMKKNIGGLGLIIMAAGGFSKYMDQIGAADVMVKVAMKPLKYIKNPYFLLIVAYLIGQIMNIFIPSATGLAMLMLITVYPILTYAGVSKMSACAIIATAAALDLGPASGVTNFTAEILEMDVTLYFVDYQLPLGIVVALGVAVAHFFTQRFYDKRETKKENIDLNIKKDLKERPTIYLILPALPLILLFIFSKLFNTGITLDVVTAILISMTIAIIFESIRTLDVKKVFDGVKTFYKGFAAMLAGVVMLIFAAQTFTLGLQALGAIDLLLDSMDNVSLGPVLIICVLMMLMATVSFLTGSAHSTFFSFAPIIAARADTWGLPAVRLLLPMQFTGGLARSFSPVSGVIIAIAAAIEESPFELIKRTAIPVAAGLVLSFAISWLI